MKKYKISEKVTAILLAVTSLTACGSVNETSVNDSSSSEISESTTQETSASSELKTETTATTKTDSYTNLETRPVNISELTTEESTVSENETSSSVAETKEEEKNETADSSSESENETVSQEVSDYKTAYIEMAESLDDGECKFNLIYFDDDDIPELVAGSDGYYTSLYTYSEGKVYPLMEHWSYGAMGNTGYEYVPRKNNLRNRNSDYAGLIVYTTYMEIGKNHTLDTIAEIETFNFDDSNGNGIPDDDETDSAGKYIKICVNGSEISEEDAEKYNIGDYEFIFGSMTLDELKSELS